jgi:hypothetical protein
LRLGARRAEVAAQLCDQFGLSPIDALAAVRAAQVLGEHEKSLTAPTPWPEYVVDEVE